MGQDWSLVAVLEPLDPDVPAARSEPIPPPLPSFAELGAFSFLAAWLVLLPYPLCDLSEQVS